MKLLVEMKLGNAAVKSHLWPITQIPRVERVFVVRDTPGPSLPKVEYHCPPVVLAKIPAAAAIYRFCLLTYLSLSKRPDYMHSYLLFPHGVITFTAAKLTRRRVGISLIAGRVELHGLGGSPLGVDLKGGLPAMGKLLLRVLKHCDIVTATGSVTADFLVSHGLKEDKVFVLHHAVAAERFHPIDIPRSYDIVSVGRLAAVKHVDVILKAMAVVKNTRPDLKVAIVGDGPCRRELEKLARDLGLGSAVSFLGVREDVVHWYNGGKVFVLASEREGFPFALVEAMMCGTPCVTSDCGDIMDVVRNGENALVVQEHDDVDGFARAIEMLLADGELRVSLGRNGLEAARRLSTDRVTADWQCVLGRAVRGD
jgi:glycosyltransferase involved in cell wall biosynthesis